MKALAQGDRGADSPVPPRFVYRTAYVALPEAVAEQYLWVESMLTTRIGPDNYPGDLTATESWPGFGPGARGVLNALTPDHLNLTGIVDLPDSRRSSGSAVSRTRSCRTAPSSI